jgi:peptidoglycan/xylan/chitin deacetylase (PgdA/CDA1 family)
LARNGGSVPDTRLTIVYHHRVFRDDARPLHRLGVAEHVLAGQLDALARRGLRTVTVSEGLARLAERRGGHWVAFSFDDGYADNVTLALPLLVAAGGRATFYLAAGLIERRTSPWWDDLAFALATARGDRLRWRQGDERYDLPIATVAARMRAVELLLPAFEASPVEQAGRLASLREALGGTAAAPCELATWEQAQMLVQAGMEMGAHTLTHPFLTRLTATEQEGEIAGSVDLVARRLGTRPRGFAYPAGDYDAASVMAVARAGLDHAVTTDVGDNRADTPRLELRRRGLPEGACLGPAGFSSRMTLAELDGAFDGWRAAHPQGRG